jgi:Protein of unknown function (DUF2975)
MARISLETPTTPEPPPPAGQPMRIGWLCHLIRTAAAALAVWTLALIAWWWSDAAAIEKAYGTFLKLDLSGASSVQYAVAVAITVSGWALYAAISYCIWRQFGTYLQGRVFTVDAAIWMRRVGMTGCAALIFSLLARHLVVIVLAFHLYAPFGALVSVPRWAGPFDALQALFSLAVIGLAQIHYAAAELADDHDKIV